MQIELAGMIPESVVDGPGLRMVIFFQGCPHHCPGCHNPETWEPGRGQLHEVDDVIRMADHPGLVRGVTLSGGEPFAQAAAAGVLAGALRERGFHVMAYTGYKWEDLMNSMDPNIVRFLQGIDLLVDGPYNEKLRDAGLAFRGSTNQRIIMVKESLKAGVPVLDRRYHRGGRP